MFSKILHNRSLSEKEMIAGCIKGNVRCEKQLYDTYSDKMFAVCVRYTGDYHLAEDVLQEGLVKVFKNIHLFRFEGSFEGWIRKIIVNTAVRMIQSKFAISPLESVGEHKETEMDNQILSELSAKELMKIIEELPLGYRTVFNLYVFEQYSHKEIAEQLNITEGTSKSQLAKARKILQEKVEINHYYKIKANG